MANYPDRNCPSCNASEYSREIFTEPSAENLEFHDVQKSWNGLFNDKYIYSYSRCKNCGLLFAPIYLTDEQLGVLYGGMPPNMEEVGGESIYKTQTGYLDFIRPDIKPTDQYLEIGPDIGLFAKKVSQKWKFDKFWMYEPNLMVVQNIQESLAGENIEIVHDLKDLSKVSDGTVGLAVLIHVLDHLTDPLRMLEQIRKKLRDGGQLLVVTHNERSILARILGKKWPAYCMQHPQLYNKKSMGELIAVSGLRLEAIKDTVNYMQISFLVKTLFWVVFKKRINVPHFLDIDIGLKLGNIVTVARK